MPKKIKTPTEGSTVAYKGFDADLRCHGGGTPFQYEVGKTYTHKGRVEQCSSGFHACQDPFDVLDFYPLIGDDGRPNRFAKVTMGGEVDRSDTKKWACSELTVEAEMTLPEMVADAIAWIKGVCKVDDTAATVEGGISDGHYAKNASSGHSAKNASSGHYAKNASSGHYATNASSGHYAKNASSGHYAKNASSGDYATNASSGHYAKNASSGHYAKNASSGHSAKNASSGHYATNASSGHYAKNASSGHYAKNASSGHSAKNASSGHYATNASSGHYAKNASSGDYAWNEASGEHSVIAGAGQNTRAKGAKGVWISLAEYELIDGNWRCIGFATGQAGFGDVPADTWLIAQGGKLVAA